ncbi:MAG TPA: thioredoxin domain-containing protein [Rudaea sp.]|nr:thioredoxin domain-containing protein [Rudaea sp.]
MNRLEHESSPYLRQHADNPVDWWPWCDEALAAARAQDKPILLSIGYSACHWCHVMAHESFEDAQTAALMNSLFINIKVDREERPDLDKIYQLAHQALNRRGGGWPLTVFLTPDDHLPFFAGTYFPDKPRHGMPPFSHILQQVSGFWHSRRDEVRTQNKALAEFLHDYERGEATAEALSDAPIRAALEQIENSFDPVHGGHMGAPKFPHCPQMELLLDLESSSRREPSTDQNTRAANDSSLSGPHPRQHATVSPGEKESGKVELTLTRIVSGGIHDQIGGGFCRYSVDERWEIPHFEKMLYDNAQLLPLLARDAAFIPAARDLLAWLLREMTSADGAFYSALDADSEHEEGKFYVWQRDEVRGLLSVAEFAVAGPHYGFDRPPNFEHVAWNPIVATPIDKVAQVLEIPLDEARRRLAMARAKLFAARSTRVRPGLDDKILTAWNALAIAGIARAARAMDAAPLMGLADNALDFLYKSVWHDGRLQASADKPVPAYLDDYSFMLDALLECLQNRWSERDLAWAIILAEALLTRFEDREHGGFYFTAHDHERLIQRPKPWMDEALPSGNGVAARALLRLGHLLGETRYIDAAQRTLRGAWPTLQSAPHACCTLLRALNDFLHPRTHVVVRARDNEEAQWRAALASIPLRRCDVYFIADTQTKLPGTLAAQTCTDGGVAYVCRGTQCEAPLQSPDELAVALGRES